MYNAFLIPKILRCMRYVSKMCSRLIIGKNISAIFQISDDASRRVMC